MDVDDIPRLPGTAPEATDQDQAQGPSQADQPDASDLEVDQADPSHPVDDGTGAGEPADESPVNDQRSQKSRRKRRQPEVPSREQILDALAKIMGLVGLGLMDPNRANAMRGAAETLLRHHQANQNGSGHGPLDLTRLRQFIREQPLLLEALEPILTNEQIDLLADEDEDDA